MLLKIFREIQFKIEPIRDAQDMSRASLIGFMFPQKMNRLFIKSYIKSLTVFF